MKINNYLASTVLVFTFFSGIYFADDIVYLRSFYHYTVRPDFFQRPYDLRIVRKHINGSIESYLVDIKTNKHQKIGKYLYVGDGPHRLESIVDSATNFISRQKDLVIRTIELIFEWP